ncbi:MAG: hypothetical protein ACI4UL_06090, partial [Muribaculaceae bacterium]
YAPLTHGYKPQLRLGLRSFRTHCGLRCLVVCVRKLVSISSASAFVLSERAAVFAVWWFAGLSTSLIF